MNRRVFPLFVAFSSLLAAQSAPTPLLSYSTYLRSGFSPATVATDASGNVYLAGLATLDPLSTSTNGLVVALNPKATAYLYVTLMSANPRAATVDPTGNLWITGGSNSLSFFAKIDPKGNVVFSKTFGAPAQSMGQAIRITADGGVLVTGLATSSGFPATTGAYSVPDTNGRPYLAKFDSSGNLIFSATGVGGSSIALDNDGDIYVSGATIQTDYPTTPGAYQTVFVPTLACISLSPIGFCGFSTNQYVTKLDPTASKLLYSTGINGMNGQPTTNTGLAVDAGGNVYVTGTTSSLAYPYTTAPAGTYVATPFVTKLDPAGKSVIWSVPQGGAGLQFDAASGSLYVAGQLNTPWTTGFVPSDVSPPPPTGMPNLPSPCLTNNLTSITESYAARVDALTGQTTAALLIGGSRVAVSSTASSAGLFWMTGPSGQADVPFTANALFPAQLAPAPSDGAYLGAIDFSQTSTVAPVVSCVLDAADQAPVGLVAPNQLITLYGSNLGPSPSVTFDGKPAQVLYGSASQINVAVPFGVGTGPSTVMQVSVNGTASMPRLFPVIPSNPALFGTASFAITGCSGVAVASGSVASVTPVVRNTGGQLNSCLTPAKPGSVVSFYVNGVGEGAPFPFRDTLPSPAALQFDVIAGSWSAEVVNVVQDNDYVWRVDVRLPAAFTPSAPQTIKVTMREGSLLVGPLQLFYVGVQAAQMPQLGAIVWVSQ